MRILLPAVLAATVALGGDAEVRAFHDALRTGELEATAAMLPELLEAADSEGDEALRRGARDAIRRIGVDAMSRHLKENPSASREVYRGLALAGPEGQRALVAWLDANHWPDHAIAAIAGCDPQVVVPSLLEKTASEDSFVRCYALLALTRFHVDPEALAPVLRRCLADPKPRVRQAALGATLRFLEVRKDASLVPLLRQRLWEEDEDICGLAATALGALGPAAAPAAADLAGIATQGPARHEALQALHDIGPAAAVGARFALTQILDDPEWRLAAAVALATVAPDENRALAVLVDGLKEEDEWGVAADVATRALVQMGRAAAAELPRLRTMRESEDPLLRVRAATVAMSASGRPEEGLPTLLAFLESGVSEDVGGADTALEAIGSLGDGARSAVPRMRKLLKNADPQLRAGVAKALWRITGDARDILPALRELLSADNSEEYILCDALQVVQEIGPLAADLLPQLRLLADSDSEWVRGAAKSAIFAAATALEDRLVAGERIDATPAMLPELLDLLTSVVLRPDRPEFRAALGDAFRQVGVEALFRHLEQHPSSASSVCSALGLSGPEGQRALVGWLDRHQWPAEGVGALMDCDEDVVVPLLIERAAGEDPVARDGAFRALVFLSYDDRLGPVLRRGLADESRPVRQLALPAVALYLDWPWHDGAPFLPLLRNGLRDPDEETSILSAKALGRLGPRAAVAAADLAAAAKRGPARLAALEALRAIGPAAAPDAADALGELLENESVRVEAARALAVIVPTHAGARQVMVEALEGSDDEGERARALDAVRGLVAMGRSAEPALPRLRQLRDGGGPLLRLFAATAAVSASGCTDEGLGILLDHLDAVVGTPGSATAEVVLEAIGGLGHGAMPAVPRLRKTLAATWPGAQVHVLRALWRVTGEPKEVEAPLRDLLAPSPDIWSYWGVLALIREIGPAASGLVPALEEFAARSRSGQRAQALATIRAMAPK